MNDGPSSHGPGDSTAEPLDVFVAYGDVNDGQRAMDLAGWFAEKIGEADMRIFPWHVSHLYDAAHEERVRRHTDLAEIFVLSLPNGAVTEGLCRWFARCLDRRPNSPPAVVNLLNDMSSDGDDPASLDPLRKIALQYRAPFFSAVPVRSLLRDAIDLHLGTGCSKESRQCP